MCIVLYSCLSCSLMPCILHLYPSMPCTLPVYPCRVPCLFIHAMYLACLSMPCTLPVYPCHVPCLFILAKMFIHAKDNGCLSMPRIMAVYPFNASFLLAIHAMCDGCLSKQSFTYVVHLSCISLVSHATHQKIHLGTLGCFPFRMVKG